MSYRVTAPLVVARQKSGSNIHLYTGSPVPDSVGKDELKRLEEGGFIESVGGSQAAPAPDEEAGDKPPAKSASKDEWVAFAESRGDTDASGKTKDELIAEHGEK